jgi:hypothetical protein
MFLVRGGEKVFRLFGPVGLFIHRQRDLMIYGSWWGIQRNQGLSFGVHIELRKRVTNSGVPFGPYVDFHFVQWVFSVGRNPIYAGADDLQKTYSRGGLSADSH